MNINKRLGKLRTKMRALSMDACIIPSSDPHQSEYPPARWKTREWISGFTGSAGTAVITMDHAGLWTDSRYYLQAEKELAESEFKLYKMDNQFTDGYIGWLQEILPSGSCVAIDGTLFSLSDKQKFEDILRRKDIDLYVTRDFVNDIWDDRQGIPVDKLFEHDKKYAGKDRKDKLIQVSAEMQKLGASHYLITTLDDIGWLFNLRGHDVEYNPVFVSYAVITSDNAVLFVNPEKVDDGLQSKLDKDDVVIQNYKTIVSYLNNLNEANTLLVDESTVSVELYESIYKARIVSGPSIVRNLKAIKNEIEIGHFRSVMVKDGVALTQAFVWLEEQLEQTAVSEYDFARKLAEFRSNQKDYYGESFSSIVGYRGNGAIIHYRPEKEGSAMIKKEGILLCDSGGQYLDGTTDITRTIALSKATKEQKNVYTRVLKGHIALAMAEFPECTTGAQLDTFARQFLWEDHKNFLHGTGHGVGFFMNVHEPPQGFAPGSSLRATTGHKAGMVSSNEPGYYKEGEYGIRIENLILSKQTKTEGFLKFETLTLFPIDTGMIDNSLMTNKEIDWLNDYHKKVLTKLSPELNKKHKEWLERKCAAL